MQTHSARHTLAIMILAPILTSGLLTGCGGGEDLPVVDNTFVAPETGLTGTFVDSPVEGLTYESTANDGTTNANGEFTYTENQKMTFSIGKITIGETTAKSVITPLDLGAEETIILPGEEGNDTKKNIVIYNTLMNNRVLNIARFLISLDEDNDPDNGIQITEATSSQITDRDINFDVEPATFAGNGRATNQLALVGKTLIDEQTATDHLKQNLSSQGISFTTLDANNAATFDGDMNGSVTVGGQTLAEGTINVTDSDDGQAFFIAISISGDYGRAFIDKNGNWSYRLASGNPVVNALTAPDTLSETLSFNSLDGSQTSVTITINGQ